MLGVSNSHASTRLAGDGPFVAEKSFWDGKAPDYHGHDTSLFPRLVLGCINADFGHKKKIIFQHFQDLHDFDTFAPFET